MHSRTLYVHKWSIGLDPTHLSDSEFFEDGVMELRVLAALHSVPPVLASLAGN